MIRNFTQEQIIKVLFDIDQIELPNLKAVSFLVDSENDLKQKVKQEFKIIHAAGGLVFKDQKVLLIHRLGCWDLPKGKKEKGENFEICAIREINEECGVNATIDTKICTTWHSYHSKGKNILKKTKWYQMQCADDSKMGPQIAEGIDRVEWKTIEEAEVLLNMSSYESIIEVLKTYQELSSNKIVV